jgi:hypothetical protein
MKSLKALFWGLFTLLLVLFLFQNREAFLHRTSLELILVGPLRFRTVPIPLYALITGALFLGVLATALYCGMANYRLHKSLRALKRENDSLQEELKSLRNLPITDAEAPEAQPVDTTGGGPEQENNGYGPGRSSEMDG